MEKLDWEHGKIDKEYILLHQVDQIQTDQTCFRDKEVRNWLIVCEITQTAFGI